MKTITIELPDKLANTFEALPQASKEKVVLIAACLVQTSPKSIETIFDKIDARMAASGISDYDINKLIDDIS